MNTKRDPPKGSIYARWNEPLPALVLPQCHQCKHYFWGTLSCEAFFPIDIPNEILSNEFDHTFEYLGDEGILFEAGDRKTHV